MKMVMKNSLNILVLCTGNSCRSQMAEGFLRKLIPEALICSAGVRPEKEVNPFAVRVMKEAGIDISHHTPDPVELFLEKSWDYVITVCDHARESCPVFSGQVKNRLHMGFPDPADARGTDEEILSVYREVRDRIREAMEGFVKAG